MYLRGILNRFFFFAILKSPVGISFYRHFIVMPLPTTPHIPSPHEPTTPHIPSPHEDTLVSEFRGLPKDALTAALSRAGDVTEKGIFSLKHYSCLSTKKYGRRFVCIYFSNCLANKNLSIPLTVVIFLFCKIFGNSTVQKTLRGSAPSTKAVTLPLAAAIKRREASLHTV